MVFGFYKVRVISRLSMTLEKYSWITCGPIFVPKDVSFLNCVVTNFPLGQDLYFVIIVSVRPTYGLDGYIFEI